jgi:hypothetical protein
MLGKDFEHRAVLSIPENHLSIIAARRQDLGKRSVRRRPDPIDVFLQTMKQRARGTIPKPNAMIVANRRNSQSPRFNANGRHHGRFPMMRIVGESKNLMRGRLPPNGGKLRYRQEDRW